MEVRMYVNRYYMYFTVPVIKNNEKIYRLCQYRDENERSRLIRYKGIILCDNKNCETMKRGIVIPSFCTILVDTVCYNTNYINYNIQTQITTYKHNFCVTRTSEDWKK